jgi:hypothetical protein
MQTPLLVESSLPILGAMQNTTMFGAGCFPSSPHGTTNGAQQLERSPKAEHPGRTETYIKTLQITCSVSDVGNGQRLKAVVSRGKPQLNLIAIN